MTLDSMGIQKPSCSVVCEELASLVDETDNSLLQRFKLAMRVVEERYDQTPEPLTKEGFTDFLYSFYRNEGCGGGYNEESINALRKKRANLSPAIQTVLAEHYARG